MAQTLKQRQREMNLEADVERERQSARSLVHSKQATDHYDVYIISAGHAPVDELIQHLQTQGITPRQLAISAPLDSLAKTVKPVVIVIGNHPLTAVEQQQIHEFAQGCLEGRIPVIFALFQRADAPDELTRDFGEGAVWVNFAASPDESAALDQLIGHILRPRT
jgi:hypothetical protein